MKNLISPKNRIPEAIRVFQENEPYPDWQEVYQYELPSPDEILNPFISLDDKTLLSFNYNLEQYTAYIERSARAKADERVKLGTFLSWDMVRELTWIRDRQICDVCWETIPWKFYHCSHIVDRVCGGSDRLDNVTVMCNVCNLFRKQCHDTKAEYYQWRDERVWKKQEMAEFEQFLREYASENGWGFQEIVSRLASEMAYLTAGDEADGHIDRPSEIEPVQPLAFTQESL